MSVIVAAILIAAVAGFAAYRLTLRRVPQIIMRRAMATLGKAAGGSNRLFHGKRPTAAARQVVMPAPDLIYSSCVYDLSWGPIRFSGPVANGYWSLSAYAENTDNFYVANDREQSDGRFDMVLTRKGDTLPAQLQSATTIVAPSDRGIVLIRMFMGDGSAVDHIREIQQSMACEVLPRT